MSQRNNRTNTVDQEIRRALSLLFLARIRIHYSWIAVFIFMTAGVTTQFSTVYSLSQRILLGLVASLLFFLLTLLRELIVAVIAVRKGGRAKSVTIFAIGAVRDIPEEAHSPALESLLAVAGMLTNLLIAGALFVSYQVRAGSSNTATNVLIQWLAFVTFMLAILDVGPGLPLNGGRIIGAIFLKTTGNYKKVTRIMSWVGWGIGAGLAIGGIVLLITTRQWFSGVLLVLPGLILQNAATHCRRFAAVAPAS